MVFYESLMHGNPEARQQLHYIQVAVGLSQFIPELRQRIYSEDDYRLYIAAAVSMRQTWRYFYDHGREESFWQLVQNASGDRLSRDEVCWDIFPRVGEKTEAQLVAVGNEAPTEPVMVGIAGVLGWERGCLSAIFQDSYGILVSPLMQQVRDVVGARGGHYARTVDLTTFMHTIAELHTAAGWPLRLALTDLQSAEEIAALARMANELAVPRTIVQLVPEGKIKQAQVLCPQVDHVVPVPDLDTVKAATDFFGAYLGAVLAE